MPMAVNSKFSAAVFNHTLGSLALSDEDSYMIVTEQLCVVKNNSVLQNNYVLLWFSWQLCFYNSQNKVIC